MKIYREINGAVTEIVLTQEELRSAYWEAQDAYDLENVLNICEWSGNEELRDTLQSDPALLRRVASRYRRYADEFFTGTDEIHALEWAYEYCTEKV